MTSQGHLGAELLGDDPAHHGAESSPVFSCTKALRIRSSQALKLVESAETQISRTGVLGEITNLASSGSSKITSEFSGFAFGRRNTCSSPAVEACGA